MIGNERLDLARHVGADNTCVAGKCTLIGDASHIVETFLPADGIFIGTTVSDGVPTVRGDVVVKMLVWHAGREKKPLAQVTPTRRNLWTFSSATV